jgi:hypothetical protein
MIYWLVTTSLVENQFEERKKQYIYAITKLVEICKNTTIKIIIIENNGKRETFLDMFKDYCTIFYTNNNLLDTHYGVKELQDILDCIEYFNINDEDYIVKITGRYYLADDSPFFNELLQINETGYEVLIKYGWWEKPSLTKVEDCISGLFCMKTKYAKTVDNSYKLDWVEHRWARTTLLIPDNKICIFKTLGVYIDPNKNGYFLV